MSACTGCGKPLCSRNVSGCCRACTGKRTGPARRKHQDKACRVCSKAISRYATSGLCREHFMAERMQSPEVQAQRTAGIRLSCAANIDQKRAILRQNHRKALRDHPTYRDELRERARAIQPLGVAASLAPDALRRRGKAISDANARKRRNSTPKRPMTFEEQLEAVASGRARIVEKWSPPSQRYDFTLAGVQDW